MSLPLFWEQIDAAFSKLWGETGRFWIQIAAGPFLVFWNNSWLWLDTASNPKEISELSLAVFVFSNSFEGLCVQPELFPEQSVHPEWTGPAEMWCWLLEIWRSLFSCLPCGDVLRKTRAWWHSWNKKVGKTRKCEGILIEWQWLREGKIKVRIKRRWKNTWIKVSLQGWQDRWGYKEVIDGCKSFGCSSVDVEDVRKEWRKTKSSHGNGENVPHFGVQKGATTAGGRMWNIPVSCSRFLGQTWLDLAISCHLGSAAAWRWCFSSWNETEGK